MRASTPNVPDGSVLYLFAAGIALAVVGALTLIPALGVGWLAPFVFAGAAGVGFAFEPARKAVAARASAETLAGYRGAPLPAVTPALRLVVSPRAGSPTEQAATAAPAASPIQRARSVQTVTAGGFCMSLINGS